MTQHEDGREFTSYATPVARRALALLTELQLSPAEYGAALKTLGLELGAKVRAELEPGATVVVTAPEDADFLTAGLLQKLTSAKLVCYWTDRLEDSATVRKQFVEPTLPARIKNVVVAKSIIASGCIVRTHLSAFLQQRQPDRILIAAPVMLKGADVALARSFPRDVAAKFEFVTFATDSKTEGKNVRPGIGGSIYERLALGANPYPALVRSRQPSVPA